MNHWLDLWLKFETDERHPMGLMFLGKRINSPSRSIKVGTISANTGLMKCGQNGSFYLASTLDATAFFHSYARIENPEYLSLTMSAILAESHLNINPCEHSFIWGINPMKIYSLRPLSSEVFFANNEYGNFNPSFVHTINNNVIHQGRNRAKKRNFNQ